MGLCTVSCVKDTHKDSAPDTETGLDSQGGFPHLVTSSKSTAAVVPSPALLKLDLRC